MTTFHFNVDLCGGACGGQLEIEANNVDEAWDKAMDMIGKKLADAFPTLGIDYNVECTDITAEELDVTDEEYEELRNSNEWDHITEIFSDNPYGFEVYANAKEFGASDPDNGLREGEDDEEWGEFLYGAYNYDGNIAIKLSSGRYFTGVAA